LRPEQHHQAGNAQRQTQPAPGAQARAIAQREAFDQRHPDGDDSNDQRCQAAGYVLLRIRQQHIAAGQQQHADQQQAQRIAESDRDLASSGQAVQQHDGSGGKKARSAHERWRNVLHRHADGKVGRAPEKVDEQERDQNAQPMLPLTRSHI